MVAEADWQVLTGQSRAPLLAVSDGSPFLLHHDVVPHWQKLVVQAAEAGFSVQIASAWRGFERQLAIWNGKAAGQRPVLDAQGNPLDIRQLSEDEWLFAILRWSAIPGCSRHHWGTDLDVFDASAVAADYCVQLTTEECVDGGVFANFHCWLDEKLQEPDAVFFRPYSRDNGGIAPERWHVSCKPIADRYEKLLDEKKLLDWLMTQDIALKDRIAVYWREIFSRYVRVSADVAGR